MCITSKDMLDINITYGCIDSIQETLDSIKKDEAYVKAELQRIKKSEGPGFENLLSDNEESKVQKSQVRKKSSAAQHKQQSIRCNSLESRKKLATNQFLASGASETVQMTELEKNKRKFVKKLDIVNESGKEFLLCFTNEQVKDSPDKV